jgi:hypothetical protein
LNSEFEWVILFFVFTIIAEIINGINKTQKPPEKYLSGGLAKMFLRFDRTFLFTHDP